MNPSQWGRGVWRSCLYPTWAANNSSNRPGSPITLQESISLAANNYQIPDCNFEGVTRTYPDPRHVGELRFLLDWQSRPSCAESIRHLCPRMAGGQHRHDPQRATSKKDIQGRVCTSNRLMGFICHSWFAGHPGPVVRGSSRLRLALGV